ncbi:MAG TPA: hypothetical protein PLS94_06930 [Prolixibacteraceae bacterium]|nr:hypothetical protein [Prolixibacteraceae bacterium]HPR60435.1 hypothetical protein [Prolixibacteraceae bacterium]
MNFISKLFKHAAYNPPKNISQTFSHIFPDVINIEWTKNDENYEAIFYQNQFENIALFNSEAGLVSHKIFLTEMHLPEIIKEDISKKGEIMNVVMINNANNVCYEIIFRDTELNRFLITYDMLGNASEKQAL